MLEVLAEQTSAVTAVKGTAASNASNARPCAPRASAAAAKESKECRKRSTSHGQLASPSDRTILLCSQRQESRGKGRFDGDIDMARARVVPSRHERRQAHLRRPVAQRPDLPRLGAGARARRRDRGHARPRRPRRRRDRAPEEPRLQGDRHGRADGVVRARTASPRTPSSGSTRVAPSTSVGCSSR